MRIVTPPSPLVSGRFLVASWSLRSLIVNAVSARTPAQFRDSEVSKILIR
jgi:hypothetical protein